MSGKGLKAGAVGLVGAVVIGVSCIAPAYMLTAALRPTVSEVGVQLPAIFLVGFVPGILVAFGYCELNNVMPDAGTSFTWASCAFGAWIGWMGSVGMVFNLGICAYAALPRMSCVAPHRLCGAGQHVLSRLLLAAGCACTSGG